MPRLRPLSARPRHEARPTRDPGPTRDAGAIRDAGSAVAEFALVAGLVSLLFAGLLQLAVALHVRNTLIDSVSEGARFGALADRSPADGAERARSLITSSLPASYAADVTATYASTGGLSTVEVTARAPVPVVALLGAGAWMTVHGHGAVETLP